MLEVCKAPQSLQTETQPERAGLTSDLRNYVEPECRFLIRWHLTEGGCVGSSPAVISVSSGLDVRAAGTTCPRFIRSLSTYIHQYAPRHIAMARPPPAHAIFEHISMTSWTTLQLYRIACAQI